MNIVIFGACECTKEYYERVYDFVKNNINGKKHSIINGGTIGTMEAVSKAAKESSIHNTGAVLNRWSEYINKYVDDVKLFDFELDRIGYMVKNGDVFVCLDGDIGTMAELFPTWIYVMDYNKPLYLVGENLTDTLNYMYDKKYADIGSKPFISFAKMEDLKFD